MGRAIVREPQAFLMDEPLSNLDAKLRVQMRAEIARLQRAARDHDDLRHPRPGRGDDAGRPHRGAARRACCSRSARRSELYDRPANLFVAGFIGSPAMNLLNASVKGETLHSALARSPSTAACATRSAACGPAQTVVVGLRPEHLLDAALNGHGGGRGAVVSFTGDVKVLEAMGAEYYAYLELPEHAAVGEMAGMDRTTAADAGVDPVARRDAGQLVARLPLDSQVRERAPITLHFDPGRLHVFDPRSGRRLTDPDG